MTTSIWFAQGGSRSIETVIEILCFDNAIVKCYILKLFTIVLPQLHELTYYMVNRISPQMISFFRLFTYIGLTKYKVLSNNWNIAHLKWTKTFKFFIEMQLMDNQRLEHQQWQKF